MEQITEQPNTQTEAFHVAICDAFHLACEELFNDPETLQALEELGII